MQRGIFKAVTEPYMYTAGRSCFFPDQHRLDSAWVPGRCRHLVHFRGSIPKDPFRNGKRIPCVRQATDSVPASRLTKRNAVDIYSVQVERIFSDILYSIGQWRREQRVIG
ncbi:hypothetical protein AVEN_155430-1 [Araneus ventricosus]|uniref:Uncharacterized protein n=1 Tax=Araneus ventricosus TaxID=182803 RepID=A0A4Y2WP16_ARAVE|nr:hypothetical protein AVEN_155430-1 [Araneus ventricosus]